MVKKLIVSGCSYTWGHGKAIGSKGKHERIPFPWPELLAKKLNMECINLAENGAGNEFIYSTILDRIMKEKNIGMVIAMWSEFKRLDFFHTKKNRWKRIGPLTIGHPNPYSDLTRNVGYELQREGFLEHQANIDKSMRIFFMFQETMKRFKFPSYQIMGTYPLTSVDLIAKNVLKFILKSPYIDMIDEETFIGWPMFKNIGGANIDEMLEQYPYKDVRISDEDTHPNQKGHEIIAEFLYENIRS